RDVDLPVVGEPSTDGQPPRSGGVAQGQRAGGAEAAVEGAQARQDEGVAGPQRQRAGGLLAESVVDGHEAQHREPTVVFEAAAAVGAGGAAEGGRGEGEAAAVEDGAAALAGGVAAEGGVGDGQRAVGIVYDAAALACGVPAEGGVGDGQGGAHVVDDAAALA